MEAALVILAFFTVMLIVPWMMRPQRTCRINAARPNASKPARHLFTSSRERRFWFWAFAVVVAIYSTLGPAQVVAETLRAHNLLRVTLGVVLLLVVGTLTIRWIKRRPSRSEIGVALGVAIVYLMILPRIESWEERTHLFEYSVVAVLIHRALNERLRHRHEILQGVLMPALLAVVITALLGWLDEGIQAFLPNRIYDIRDVGFNALAGLMVIVASLALAKTQQWVDIFVQKRGRN